MDHEDPPHQAQTTHEYIDAFSTHLRAQGAAMRLHSVRIATLLAAVRTRRTAAQPHSRTAAQPHSRTRYRRPSTHSNAGLRA